MRSGCLALVLVGVLAFLLGCGYTPPPDTPATWHEARWGGVTTQELDNSCGLASLVTIMRFHFGDDITERQLLEDYLANTESAAVALAMRQGLSLLELERLAQRQGYQVRRAMLSLKKLAELAQFAPVLVYLNVDGFRHFAVVRGISEKEVLLADSSRGNVRYSRAQFLREWRAPESIAAEWEHPGGLVLFRDGTSDGELLTTPDGRSPTSFFSLRRDMLFLQ